MENDENEAVEEEEDEEEDEDEAIKEAERDRLVGEYIEKVL